MTGFDLCLPWQLPPLLQVQTSCMALPTLPSSSPFILLPRGCCLSDNPSFCVAPAHCDGSAHMPLCMLPRSPGQTPALLSSLQEAAQTLRSLLQPLADLGLFPQPCSGTYLPDAPSLQSQWAASRPGMVVAHQGALSPALTVFRLTAQ